MKPAHLLAVAMISTSAMTAWSTALAQAWPFSGENVASKGVVHVGPVVIGNGELLVKIFNSKTGKSFDVRVPEEPPVNLGTIFQMEQLPIVPTFYNLSHTADLKSVSFDVKVKAGDCRRYTTIWEDGSYWLKTSWLGEQYRDHTKIKCSF